MSRAEPEQGPSWQDRALERSLGAARARALARSSKFLASALELVEETGALEFTVQEVVDRSQLSVRAFYQHFAGKDDFLLALFEELLGEFVEELGREVLAQDDPFDQLEAFVRGYLSRAHLSRPVGGRVLTNYNLRLAVEHPDDYSRAIRPQLNLLAGIVSLGIEQKVFRSDLPAMTVALLINAQLVSMAQMEVMEIPMATPVTVDEVWSWCRSAVRPPLSNTNARAHTSE